MQLGINFKNKTPKKEARLPEFSLKDSLVGFNNALRSCFDVKHYEIHLRINTSQKSISGFVTTRFELLNHSKKIQLDLDAQMLIDSILQGSHAVHFSRELTAVYVDLLSDQSSQSITVYYHGKPLQARRPPWDGGFIWKKDKNKKPFISVACEGSGAKTWLPVKTYLGDEPDSVSLYLTIPKELVAASNGNLISENENGNETTYHWQTSYPVNPYNITFYVGDYKLIETLYTCIDGEKMNLRYYVLPYNYEKAKTHFIQAEKILHIYEDLFGKYPWPKDSYKLVESPYEGMEHQTAIAYGNGYKNERNTEYDYIILHESAHEWWGNAVTVADFSDIWIHEGMATYAEALYIEKTKGHKAYLDYINGICLLVMNKKPLIGPQGVYYWNYNDNDPYSKGAAMLHTLRNHLRDDTLFFSILKSFFKKYCYKTADTKDFIALVNQMTGKDLNYFFDQYLYRRDSPYLKWNFDYDFDLKKDQLIFQFDRVNANFTTPIEVEQGGDTFYVTPTSEVQFFTLPHPAYIPLRVNPGNSYLQDGYKKLEKRKSR
jgi:aminopeptidase N